MATLVAVVGFKVEIIERQRLNKLKRSVMLWNRVTEWLALSCGVRGDPCSIPDNVEPFFEGINNFNRTFLVEFNLVKFV